MRREIVKFCLLGIMILISVTASYNYISISEQGLRRVHGSVIFPRIDLGDYKLEYRGRGYTFLDPFQREFPDNEKNFESYLSGPNIAFRFEKFIKENALGSILQQKIPQFTITLQGALNEIRRIQDLLGKDPKELKEDVLKTLDQEAEKLEDLIKGVNKFITEQAKVNPQIKDFLVEIGREFGHALGFYMVNIRKILLENERPQSEVDELISKVVLVGGVAEHLGLNLTADPLINEGVIGGVNEVFQKTGIRGIKPDIRRTQYQGNFPRDFWAFLPKKSDEYSTAVTVGGTKILAGSVDKDGELLSGKISGGSWKTKLTGQGILPSQEEAAKSAVIDYIVKLINEVNENTKHIGKTPAKIGISWAGSGEYRDGKVIGTNIWGLGKGINLIEELQERLSPGLKNIPIEIQHDGIAAAKGEISSQGTFKNENNLLAVIWGTGIGAGVLIDKGAYYDIPTLRALGIPLGEIGHHIIFVTKP
ncbi:MAG: ROK family protein [Candidatus Omnitrophica bacterium]|nr:ROK family protein [Candidatus Omnitrophota bacterium]